MSYAEGDIVKVDFLHLDKAVQEGPRTGNKGECATYRIEAKYRPMLVTLVHASGWFVLLKMTSQAPPRSCEHLYFRLKEESFIEIYREHWYPKNLLKSLYTRLDPGAFAAIQKEICYHKLGRGPR